MATAFEVGHQGRKKAILEWAKGHSLRELSGNEASDVSAFLNPTVTAPSRRSRSWERERLRFGSVPASTGGISRRQANELMRRFAAVLKARNSKTTGRMYGSRRDRRGLVEGVATSETGRNQDRGGEYRCVGQQHQLKSVGFFVDPGVYPVHRGTPHNYSPAWQASWHTSAPVHNRCFGLGKPLATSRLEKR